MTLQTGYHPPAPYEALSRTAEHIMRGANSIDGMAYASDVPVLIAEIERLRTKCAMQAGVISGLTEARCRPVQSLTFWLGGDAP